MVDSISGRRESMAEYIGKKRQGLERDVRDLKRQGYSNIAIATRLGISESKVRNILKDTQPTLDIDVDVDVEGRGSGKRVPKHRADY